MTKTPLREVSGKSVVEQKVQCIDTYIYIMASLTVETWTCDACGNESDTKLKCCANCRSVYYCILKH